MPTASIAESHLARTGYAHLAQGAIFDGADDALTARRWACGVHPQPLARLAALLVSISRNNTYEGRDPRTMPEALTSGFVADLLGVDISKLAGLLVELRNRGLIESGADATLRLRDIRGLERLAN